MKPGNRTGKNRVGANSAAGCREREERNMRSGLFGRNDR
jgi:hypothetical protein